MSKRQPPGPSTPTVPGLNTLQFATLTEVKARLSAHVRELRAHERRLVITVGGKPAAVLLAYDELLASDPAAGVTVEAGATPPALPSSSAPLRVIDVEEWREERPARERVRDSILSLFDAPALSRKGQKRYKREKVRGGRP